MEGSVAPGPAPVARPWQILETAPSAAGPLELRRRDDGDYLITVSGRVLMNSRNARSEAWLGGLAEGIARRPSPRVLVGGLGMGCTLRAALDALPDDATVHVVELEPAVVEWCRGPLAPLTDAAVLDPRVSVEIGDVAAAISRSAASRSRFDAILLDLFEGPDEKGQRDVAIFGRRGLAHTRGALSAGGLYAVWSERPGPAFEKRLVRAGFRFECRRPGKGGLRHAVYVATAQ